MRVVTASAHRGRPVWDLPLRIFHWTLLATVAAAAVTGFLLPLTWLTIHLAAGVTLGVLLLFRLVWGFSGSTYSRFASFVFSPTRTWRFVKDQMAGRAQHFDGHNPLGAVMIFALLAVLLALVVTGTLALGGTEKQGPLRAVISYATGRAALSLHELAAYVLLGLVAGHVGGVILESLRSGENLPRAMVTGRKRTAGEIAGPAARPLAAAGALVAAAAVLSLPASALWRLPAPGVPAAAVDDAYARACGDCHVVFHPSLRSEATWTRMMDALDDHFGEDASLAGDEAESLKAYLAANAAEHWDTRAANVFRAEDPNDPLRITATAFWRRRHAGLDPAHFKLSSVGTKSNCNACHADAALGLFAPQAIKLPKE